MLPQRPGVNNAGKCGAHGREKKPGWLTRGLGASVALRRRLDYRGTMPSRCFIPAVDSALESLRHLNLESVLLPVLCQLAVIIVAARLFSWLLRKLGQPGVVGEIAAGIALGPSVLGYFAPTLQRAIFHPQLPGVDPALSDELLRWIFSTLAQVGLVFVLFLIGLEFDFSHLRRHSRAAAAISIAGVALPFLLGLGLSHLLLPDVGLSGCRERPRAGTGVSRCFSARRSPLRRSPCSAASCWS